MSRVPTSENIDQQTRQWMDAVDKRQLKLGQLSDLDSGATLAEAIAKINAMLATQRTR